MNDPAFLFQPFDALWMEWHLPSELPVARRVRVISADKSHALVIAGENFERSPNSDGSPPPRRGQVFTIWLDSLTAVL